MIEAPTMNRIIDFVPSVDLGKIWSLFKVTEPRFTHIQSVRDTDWNDPREPRWYGTVYHDSEFDKNYFVEKDIDSDWGGDYVAIYSIKEILSPATIPSEFSDQDIKKSFKLKPADVDVENDMMDQFKINVPKAGMTLKDQRKRIHGAGISQPSNHKNSLS